MYKRQHYYNLIEHHLRRTVRRCCFQQNDKTAYRAHLPSQCISCNAERNMQLWSRLQRGSQLCVKSAQVRAHTKMCLRDRNFYRQLCYRNRFYPLCPVWDDCRDCFHAEICAEAFRNTSQEKGAFSCAFNQITQLTDKNTLHRH